MSAGAGVFSPDESPLEELTDRTRTVLEWGRAAGLPVVYSARPGGQTPGQRGLQLDNVADSSREEHQIAPRYAAGRRARVSTVESLLDRPTRI